MALRDPLPLLPTLVLFVACGSAVAPDASDASTGMSSTSTAGESESSDSGAASTSTAAEGSTTTSTDETGAALSSSTGSSSTGDESAEVSICTYQCEVDDDCLLSGSFFGLTCSDGGSCIAACEVSEECTPIASGWLSQSCAANDECPGGVCVDFGQPDGAGGCGIAPAEGITCRQFGSEETEGVDIDGNPAVVCAVQAECTDVEDVGRVCVPIGDFGPNCERDGCVTGLSCRADGLCGCEDDDACRLADSGDTCFDGFCINDCSSTDDCDGSSPFDGGEFICTPLE